MIDIDNWQDRPIYNSNGEMVYKNLEDWRNEKISEPIVIPCEPTVEE